jgi:hypothetical protein
LSNTGVDPAAKAAQEAEAAIHEYEFSRDRYMHSLRVAAEEQVAKAVGPRREKLAQEIENLRSLVRVRSEARTEAVKAYAQRCPGRVQGTAFLPPAPTDRVGNFGVDKLFKAAMKAHEELTEVNEILKKRREALDALDTEMRSILQKRNEDLIKMLETPVGLENAFKRDPLLGRAHARMKAAVAQRDALRGTGAAVPGIAAS